MTASFKANRFFGVIDSFMAQFGPKSHSATPTPSSPLSGTKKVVGCSLYKTNGG